MLIIKGLIIGIGKILPGVSGSVLAISLGVYDKLINALTNLFNKKNLLLIFKLSIGFVIAVAIGSNAITFFLNRYYLQTMLLFIGLILGTQYGIYNKITNYKHIILSVIAFIISLLLNSTLQLGLFNITGFFKYLILGMLEAISTIIPGISGTALFISLGVYDEVLYMFSNILNISTIFNNYQTILPFILGMICALVLLVKIIGYLLKKYESLFFAAVFGFSISALYTMFEQTFKYNYSFIQIITGILSLTAGYLASKYLIKDNN